MSENLLIAIISSTTFSTIIIKVIDVIIKKKQGTSLVERGVVALMGMQLRNQCEGAIKRGNISLEELKQINDMNILYHEMGGNGYVKSLMEKVEHLPNEVSQ